MSKQKCAALAAGLLLASAAAQAALVNRGGGLIYDTVNDITWLADMNYAFTSGYASAGQAPNGDNGTNALWTDGRMGWAAAWQWADTLVYSGYSDWRLPTLNGADASCSNSFDPGNGFPIQHYGGNCTGGELSHLFVADLGHGATAEQRANLLLFKNVQDDFYWSGSSYLPNPASKWVFVAYSGNQLSISVDGAPVHAIAVRSGDVVSSIPEPNALLLAFSLLVVSTCVRRRAKQPVDGTAPVGLQR